MEDLISKLKTKFKDATDIELRVGERAFRKEYSSDNLRAGGFYADAIEVDGEDVTVGRETVVKTPVSILYFRVGNVSYEARCGMTSLAAQHEEEGRKEEAARGKAAAEAEEKAVIAARKERTEPSNFEFTGTIRLKDGQHFVEAPAGTFVPGDRVTVPDPNDRWEPFEVVVTGIGDDYDGMHRGYVMPVEKYDALSDVERRKLPKTAEQAVRAKIVAKTAEVRKPAKMLGAKALKGTPKQKLWAESIRSAVLAQASDSEAERIISGAKFQSAKFWIDNRERLMAYAHDPRLSVDGLI